MRPAGCGWLSISWKQWLGMAQHGVSAFAFLSIGTGSGAILTGAFANELHSSLDIVFANGGHSSLARLSSCSAGAQAYPLLWRVASRAARGELVELVLARFDNTD
jgi:hypothetical protein